MLCLVVLPLAGQTKKKTESFWNKILRIAGVSANPSSLRGEDRAAAGDVWMAAAGPQPAPRRLTRDGGYRSPVFDSADQAILVLKENELYRVTLNGDAPAKVRSLPGVSKLVGISREDSDQILVLTKGSGSGMEAALLSLRTGAVTTIPHDPDARDDGLLLVHLAGWERVYGDVRLYCEEEEKEAAGGIMIRYTDVYLKRGAEAAVNLTNGNGSSSCQPSLSADGKRVVLIRAVR
jgi:hypothetical protein